MFPQVIGGPGDFLSQFFQNLEVLKQGPYQRTCFSWCESMNVSILWHMFCTLHFLANASVSVLFVFVLLLLLCYMLNYVHSQ